MKLAASWGRLGVHKADIERGWTAITNPEMYREIGQEPDELVAAGIAALRERYNLPE